MIFSEYIKTYILCSFLVYSAIIVAQPTLCRTNILNERKSILEKSIEPFVLYDFSKIWLNKEKKNPVYGIIGDNYQRIKIEFSQIERNRQNPKEYLVSGSSTIRNNKTPFVGKIEIDSIRKITSESFGVDDMYKDSGIAYQGLINAKYLFYEDENLKDSGYFEGTLQTLFYIDKNNEPQYNDIENYSDGYFNNAFVGIWKKYNSPLIKVCNWGDFRVPYTKCDFDIGAGEFSVSDKYEMNGW